jgi:hypothetical protein
MYEITMDYKGKAVLDFKFKFSPCCKCSKLSYPKESLLRKAVPLQAWSGPEGSRKLRFPDFMTTAQDGGKVISLTHRPPLPDNHFC